jgi:hypothetical protein
MIYGCDDNISTELVVVYMFRMNFGLKIRLSKGPLFLWNKEMF